MDREVEPSLDARPVRARWADRVLPRDRVPRVRLLLVALVVFDSVATYVWVRTGIAVEGNPLVASVMEAYGDGVGLLLRTVWSVALVLALTWLADRHVVARLALVLVVAALGAVALLHTAALGWVGSRLLLGVT
ncbi:MAG: DUF5658 family protein [Nitriliruptoraceae bacterium]